MADYNDYITEQQSIARRQAMLQALQAQGANAPINGNNTVARLIQTLAKVGGGVMGNMGQEKLDARAGANASQYQAGLSDAIGQYMTKRMGAPSQQDINPAGPPTEDGQAPAIVPGMMTPEVKPDPRGAVMGAIASRYPELQKMGLAEANAMNKGSEPSFGTEAKAGMNPETGKVDQFVVDKNGNKRWLNAAPQQELIPVAPGSSLADKHSGTVALPGAQAGPLVSGASLGMSGDDAKDQYQQGADGRWHSVNQGKQGKTSISVGGPNINVSAQKGEDAFAKALGGDTAKRFADSRDDAAKAYKSQTTVNQMQALEKAGVFSGPGANLATSLAGFAKSFGIPVDEAKLANSESFRKEFAKVIADQVTGSAGRSITDSDSRMIQDSLPSMLQSPAGRAKIYEIMAKNAKASIARHTSFQSKLVERYPDQKGLLTLNPIDGDVEAPYNTPVPGAGAGTTPGVRKYNPATGKIE